MTWLLRGLWISLSILGGATHASNVDSSIAIQVSRANGGFEVNASYFAPLSQCQSYVLLTDFSDSIPSEGIQSSKVTRLNENTVRVEQQVEDKVLFFSTRFESIIDYTEYPMTGMDLKQIQGYFKEYRGSWRLKPSTSGTLFVYNAFLLPDSAIPMFVIEQFMNGRIQKRFEKMALRANSKMGIIPDQCK